MDLEFSPDITSEQYPTQEELCQREAPPLGPLESASLDSDVAMEGKWPRDLLPKAGWATSRGLQEGAVGQELLSRTDVCPAESTATGVKSLGAGLQLCGCRELNLDPVEEQPVFLTTEQSFQSPLLRVLLVLQWIRPYIDDLDPCVVEFDARLDAGAEDTSEQEIWCGSQKGSEAFFPPLHPQISSSVLTPSGAHDPNYENITLAFRNKDQLKPSQPAPRKQAQFKSSLDKPQVPPWLHRTIMILYVLLALIFASCIILSALILVKNSEMSRELWSLRGELSNVSNIVLNCQDQQRDHWKSVQNGILEAKNNINQVLSKVHSGNEKLKTVPAGFGAPASPRCSLTMTNTGRTMANTGPTMANTGRTMANTGPTMANTGRTMANTGLTMANTGLTMANTDRTMANTGPTMANTSKFVLSPSLSLVKPLDD
ncbi:hypothetical protein STEG23_009329 [Scotinomys teguina]